MVSENEEEVRKPKKRVAKTKRSKPAYSPEEIETRYQAHLEKIRGGK